MMEFDKFDDFKAQYVIKAREVLSHPERFTAMLTVDTAEGEQRFSKKFGEADALIKWLKDVPARDVKFYMIHDAAKPESVHKDRAFDESTVRSWTQEPDAETLAKRLYWKDCRAESVAAAQ